MNQAPDLPGWAALLVGVLVLGGALFAFIGSLGLARLPTFYQRIHPPTLGSSLGAGLTALGSIVCFSVLGGRVSVHEVLVFLFVTVTTPVTFMLVTRAAVYRDRVEGSPDVPADIAEPPAS